MTDYNDGNWHAWHGGECPVHPKTTVEAVWHDPRMDTAGFQPERTAREDEGPRLAWSHVVKFRVVKAYGEPREGWAVVLFATAREAKTAYPGCAPIHVKEITE